MTGEALRQASILTATKKVAQGSSLIGTIGNGLSLTNSGFTAARQISDQVCSQCPRLNMNLKEPQRQPRQAEMRPLDMSYSAQQARQQTADFWAQQKARQGATMDAFAGQATTPLLNFTKEAVQSPLRNGYGLVENIRDGNGWKAAGFGALLFLDASPFTKGGGAMGGKVAFGFANEARELAKKIQGSHLMDDPNWKRSAMGIFNNPKYEVHFSLNGIDETPMNMILNPGRSNTNWEISQLYQSSNFANAIFHYGGQTYKGYDVFKIKP